MPVKQEPVSIKWQIIFTFIPILNLYAFYKIQKLRLFLCFIIPISIAGRFLDALSGMQNVLRHEASLGAVLILSILLTGLGIGLSIWFVRKWSKQWNEKFS